MHKVEAAWQKVARSIKNTVRLVEKFQELHREFPPAKMQTLSLKAQVLFTSSILQSRPEHFMEEIVMYAVRNGGLDYLLLPTESEEEKKSDIGREIIKELTPVI